MSGLELFAAALGVGALIAASATAFMVLKWVGAAYLFYIAWQLWRAPVSETVVASDHPGGTWRLARQEFWVAAGNPKAILIFTAFLPQFVDPGADVGHQFAVLGALFLLLEWIAIGIYACIGQSLIDHRRVRFRWVSVGSLQRNEQPFDAMMVKATRQAAVRLPRCNAQQPTFLVKLAQHTGYPVIKRFIDEAIFTQCQECRAIMFGQILMGFGIGMGQQVQQHRQPAPRRGR